MTDFTKLPWRQAKKHKAIFARPVATLINDVHFFSMLLLQTLEGPQKLDIKDGAIICTGLNKSDPWTQSATSLLSGYDVTDITADGWMYCEVKKDAPAVYCCEITEDIQLPGKIDAEGRQYNYALGDYLCRRENNYSAIWVVRRAQFQHTYTVHA